MYCGWNLHKDGTGLQVLDLGARNPAYNSFCGGFTDQSGRYLYLGPRYMNTTVVRVDLTDFQTVESVDVGPLLPANANGQFQAQGCFSDGRFGYMPSNYPGCLVRFQLFNSGKY